jgi:ketosteroid isomerase-like protein
MMGEPSLKMGGFRTVGAALAACMAVALPTTASAAACPRADHAAEAATSTMRAMYAAATADDETAFRATIAPDFYAFDNGRRFNGAELFGLIKAAHAAGKTYVWTVPSPDVHVACDVAWLTYVNNGSVSDASGRQPRTWLESAVLRFQDGRWRISFFHSTSQPAT